MGKRYAVVWYPPATGRWMLSLLQIHEDSFSNKVLAQRIQSSNTDLTQVDLYIADIKDCDEEL